MFHVCKYINIHIFVCPKMCPTHRTRSYVSTVTAIITVGPSTGWSASQWLQPQSMAARGCGAVLPHSHWTLQEAIHCRRCGGQQRALRLSVASVLTRADLQALFESASATRAAEHGAHMTLVPNKRCPAVRLPVVAPRSNAARCVS